MNHGKIDETLRKLAGNIPTGNPAEAGAAQPGGPAEAARPGQAGDPDCPLCQGVGYLRRDLPVGHPDFGRLEVCTCRHQSVSAQIHQRLFALSNLSELAGLTFENFQTRGRVGLRPVQADSLEQAYNQARMYAAHLKGWLLLQGDYGCGKTHLAAAIANFAVGMGVPTLFLTVPDLLDTLRFAYDDPEATFESRFDEVRNAPLLVMDDFGTQNATPWAQEKLFQVLNYRYINRLPLVVTTNLMLTEIEGRIRSRLEDPEMVTRVLIRAPDHRRPAEELADSDISYLNLLSKLTFASFDQRKNEGLPPEQTRSLSDAFEAAREFAAHPDGWLVITGPYGCGKTHLAAAIANYQLDLGYYPVFVDVPDMLSRLRATFSAGSSTSLDRRFEAYRGARLLILDDLGTQASTPWVKEKLYQLFNYRYLAELPTVVTTAEFKEEMDARLLSRMQDTRLCRIVAITAPSYRGINSPARRGRAKPARRKE